MRNELFAACVVVMFAFTAAAPRLLTAQAGQSDQSGQMASTSQGQLVHVTGARVEAPFITVRELIRNGYNLQHIPRSFIVTVEVLVIDHVERPSEN